MYYLRDLISYTVEHYKQRYNASGAESWILSDTDLLSGLFDTEATFAEKTYPNFSFDPTLISTGSIPATDRTLVVKLYYKQNPVSYTVEHYKQSAIKGVDGSVNWILSDTETLTGFPGVEAPVNKKNYAGLFFDASLTEPASRIIPCRWKSYD